MARGPGAAEAPLPPCALTLQSCALASDSFGHVQAYCALDSWLNSCTWPSGPIHLTLGVASVLPKHCRSLNDAMAMVAAWSRVGSRCVGCNRAIGQPRHMASVHERGVRLLCNLEAACPERCSFRQGLIEAVYRGNEHFQLGAEVVLLSPGMAAKIMS